MHFNFFYFQTDPLHTPLHSAVLAGDDKTVELLLVSGADRNAKDLRVNCLLIVELTCNLQIIYPILTLNIII